MMPSRLPEALVALEKWRASLNAVLMVSPRVAQSTNQLEATVKSLDVSIGLLRAIIAERDGDGAEGG